MVRARFAPDPELSRGGNHHHWTVVVQCCSHEAMKKPMCCSYQRQITNKMVDPGLDASLFQGTAHNHSHLGETDLILSTYQNTENPEDTHREKMPNRLVCTIFQRVSKTELHNCPPFPPLYRYPTSLPCQGIPRSRSRFS